MSRTCCHGVPGRGAEIGAGYIAKVRSKIPRRGRASTLAGTLSLALLLTGCAAGASATGSAFDSIVIGTTSSLSQLDPAASHVRGSTTVQTQVFASLLTSDPGSSDLVPDLASSAAFSSPTQFTVTLQPGLTFANGHRLTSSDVVFSFERQAAIHAAGGPVPVLDGLATVAARDERTVVFQLKNVDASFPRVLTTAASAIVDEQVFSARTLTDDATIVKNHAFDGQYTVDSYHPGRVITFIRNRHYSGALGPAVTPNVSLKHYSNARDLRLDLQGGALDVAEGIAAADVPAFRQRTAYTVVDGPGTDMQYLVFDLDTMPYAGDAAKSLLIRRAVADLVDRHKLSAVPGADAELPLYSFVPGGVSDSMPLLKKDYGDGAGGPDVTKAAALLTGAGLSIPITLNVEYNTNLFGASSKALYSELKDELGLGGLFRVVLAKADFPQYETDRRAGVYPAYQFSTATALADAGRSLQQTFGSSGVASAANGDNSINDRIKAQATEVDAVKRAADLADIQNALAAGLPILPLLQTAQVVVMSSDVSGARLDASQQFRFGTLVKG